MQNEQVTDPPQTPGTRYRVTCYRHELGPSYWAGDYKHYWQANLKSWWLHQLGYGCNTWKHLNSSSKGDPHAA